MKSSEILREAARIVEGGEEAHSCCAIYAAIKAFGPPSFNDALYEVVGRYNPLYLPDAPYPASLFWAGHKDDISAAAWTSDDRVIALCLAAAIAEDEGD